MKSNRSALDLAQETVKTIQEEAKAGKHKSLYDRVSHQYFSYQYYSESDEKSIDFINKRIKEMGKEQFIDTVLDAGQTTQFKDVAEEFKDNMLETFTKENIKEDYYYIMISHLSILNGVCTAYNRCHYALLKLFSEKIDEPISVFYLLTDNSKIGHQVLVIGNCDAIVAIEETVTIQDLQKKLSRDHIVVDPTLYFACTLEQLPNLLTEKYPNSHFKKATKFSTIWLDIPQVNGIIKLASTLDKKIKASGFKKYTYDQAKKLIDQSLKEYSKNRLVLAKESAAQYHHKIKHFMGDIQLNIQSHKALSEDGLKEYINLRTNWVKKSLAILQDEKAVSLEDPNKILKVFQKKWKSFKNSIGPLTSATLLEKANDKINRLIKLFAEEEQSLRDAKKRMKQLIKKYNKKPVETITFAPSITEDYQQKLSEKKESFLKLYEEYTSKRNDLTAIYDKMNNLYKSLYDGKEYYPPKILDKKNDTTASLKTEIALYEASAENIKKIEEHGIKISSLLTETEQEISHFKKLIDNYQKKKDGAKDTLSIAPTATTFGNKKNKKSNFNYSAKTRDNRLGR